jgi:gamma-glutamylcyclotransferase (GGCT)/AIG2-like uncharacterized protein YtfP
MRTILPGLWTSGRFVKNTAAKVRTRNINVMAVRAEEFPGRGKHVFVYGTLVDPRRLREVLGHAPPGEVLRARLRGYRRVTTPAYEYPFVVEDPDASVEGLVVMDLAAPELESLDAYEDVAGGVYCRVPVEVEALGCGPRTTHLRAEAYAAGPALLDGIPLAL